MKRNDLKITACAIQQVLDVFGIASVRQLKPSDSNFKGTPFDCGMDTIQRIIRAANGSTVSLSTDSAADVARQCGLTVVKNGLGYDVRLPNAMDWHTLKAWQKESMRLRGIDPPERID